MLTLLNDIEFAYPWVLIFLLIIPMLIWRYAVRATQSNASIFVSTVTYFATKKGIRTNLYHILFALRCLAITSVIIALARPQKKLSIHYITGNGIDIMLNLDVSASMEPLDFEPNRMEASKAIAQNFVRNRLGDRIGVVVFSSKCFLLCPLTTGTNAVINQLSTIKIKAFPTEDASLINSSIVLSISKLKNSNVKSKVIILISDGIIQNDNISTETVIQLSKKYGIKIYTVGVGSGNEVPVVVRSINSAGEVVSENVRNKTFGFNEDFLKQLAKSSGGRYFYAKDKINLESIYETINELEKSDIQLSTENNVQDKYLLFVLVAILVLFFETVLRYSVLRRFP